MKQKVRIWDLPTRLFHWLLLLCVIGAFVCVNLADISSGPIADLGIYWLSYHVFFGYSVACLLLFRIVWGFVGGHYSRFTTFIKSPCTIIAYLKGRYTHYFGHNPLGALSVLAILFALTLQVLSGFFMPDDVAGISGGAFSALSKYFPVFIKIHHRLPNLIILLILLHIVAIAFYRLKGKNLIKPMVTGDVETDLISVSNSQDNTKQRLWALLIFILCICAVLIMIQLAPSTSESLDFM